MDARHHPPHREHESPLTFLHAKSSSGSLSSTSLFSSVQRFSKEVVAAMTRRGGDLVREHAYKETALEEHETLDTLAVRRLQSFFRWTPIGAVARASLQPGMSYCLILGCASYGAPSDILEHVAERLLEASPFIQNPANAWICPPDRMHILLSTAGQSSDDVGVMCANSSPLELKLERLFWRRNGTLWAQWSVTRGNIDRLRLDLRIATGAKWDDTFTDDHEDPTRCRPLLVESLVMAVLHTPSHADFKTLRATTHRLSDEFKDTRATFHSVQRVISQQTPIDRSGPFESLPLLDHFPEMTGDISKILWGFHLVRHSPSLKRVTLVSTASVLAALWISNLVFKNIHVPRGLIESFTKRN